MMDMNINVLRDVCGFDCINNHPNLGGLGHKKKISNTFRILRSKAHSFYSAS